MIRPLLFGLDDSVILLWEQKHILYPIPLNGRCIYRCSLAAQRPCHVFHSTLLYTRVAAAFRRSRVKKEVSIALDLEHSLTFGSVVLVASRERPHFFSPLALVSASNSRLWPGPHWTPHNIGHWLRTRTPDQPMKNAQHQTNKKWPIHVEKLIMLPDTSTNIDNKLWNHTQFHLEKGDNLARFQKWQTSKSVIVSNLKQSSQSISQSRLLEIFIGMQ